MVRLGSGAEPKLIKVCKYLNDDLVTRLLPELDIPLLLQLPK